MKIKKIVLVYLRIYSVYLDIYDWPKVYLHIYGDILLANRICRDIRLYVCNSVYVSIYQYEILR